TETIHITSSVISNNANRVIKTLTIITVIISVPMIISSFYGMNVNLPLSQNPFAFWLILLICIILSIVLWLTLRWRKLY
ncbi:MAG TPA: CorA family divalent cation transporter, partial [Candidatus Diapherotrites archaeon]|nr:CorA family divalent cation transporter [Candidatus Diapherotrites archaeon]